MSWDNITGDAKIIPSSGGLNEIKLETGKAKKVKLILPNGSEPYSFFEHALEVESFENGQATKTFRTVRCPKTAKDPNARCPLCDGQQVRRRIRHACNVWDYDTASVQKLNAGEDVFKPIATTRKLNVDILGVDWALLKTGEGRNGTEYSATNLGPTALQVIPADAKLFDIEADMKPHTIEEMQAIVESAGGNWAKLIVPPELVYPTLQEALDHEMPNGKYKGQKLSAVWEADKSNRGMINFLALKSDRMSAEKSAAQVILVRLGGVGIPGVPTSDGMQIPTQVPTQTTAPVQTAPVQTQQVAQPTTQAPVQANTGKQDKIAKINGYFTTKEVFIKGGFAVVIDAMKSVSGGKTNIIEFTDAEIDAMLAYCEKA